MNIVELSPALIGMIVLGELLVRYCKRREFSRLKSFKYGFNTGMIIDCVFLVYAALAGQYAIDRIIGTFLFGVGLSVLIGLRCSFSEYE